MHALTAMTPGTPATQKSNPAVRKGCQTNALAVVRALKFMGVGHYSNHDLGRRVGTVATEDRREAAGAVAGKAGATGGSSPEAEAAA